MSPSANESGSLHDFVGSDAPGADAEPADASVHERPHALEIGLEPAGSDVVSVADDPADNRGLAADFAVLGHGASRVLSRRQSPVQEHASIAQPVTEDPKYLSTQLITYLGNKRALLPDLHRALARVAERLGRRKLRTFDGFAGSGVVSRLLKSRSNLFIYN